MPKAEPWATTQPMPKAWFRQPSHAGDRDHSGKAFNILTPNLGEAVIAIAIGITIAIDIDIAIAIAIAIAISIAVAISIAIAIAMAIAIQGRVCMYACLHKRRAKARHTYIQYMHGHRYIEYILI